MENKDNHGSEDHKNDKVADKTSILAKIRKHFTGSVLHNAFVVNGLKGFQLRNIQKVRPGSVPLYKLYEPVNTSIGSTPTDSTIENIIYCKS